jgi:hypothetical protein
MGMERGLFGLLATGSRDALDEGFLGEEEEQDDGEGEEGAGGHELHPVDVRVVDELLEAVSEGVLAGIAEVEEGAEEVVPGSEESEESAGGEGRFAERDDEAAEDDPLISTVDFCGFGHFVGKSFEELAEKEDVERGGAEGGNDEG